MLADGGECVSDLAAVRESSAALGFSEMLPNRDYYASITIPSLIVRAP